MITSFFLLLLQEAEAPPVTTTTKPPGGDDAFHPGVAPRLVATKPRKKRDELEDIERLYDKVMGLIPDEPSPVVQEAIEAAQEAISGYSGAKVAQDLPPASTVDFAALVSDLNAVLALREAYARLLEDDDEEVITAILLAA